MNNKAILLSVFLLHLCSIFGHSQTTTTFSYQNISSYLPGTCFFNNPPGPNGPFLIGGKNHYGIVGGVDYSGNEFVLNANNSGQGSGFGIYYGFKQNYSYDVAVTVSASSTSMVLLWAINQYRTAVPASCSPGFAPIITQSASLTSSQTNIGSTYSTFTIIGNFSPSAANINYLLLSAYNNASSIGNVKIKSVTITEYPPCYPATVTGVQKISANDIKVTFTPGSGPAQLTITNNEAYILHYYYHPPFGQIQFRDENDFGNVGTASPITLHYPYPLVTGQNDTYIIRMTGVCNNVSGHPSYYSVHF